MLKFIAGHQINPLIFFLPLIPSKICDFIIKIVLILIKSNRQIIIDNIT